MSYLLESAICREVETRAKNNHDINDDIVLLLWKEINENKKSCLRANK
jgi:hypothetical protein